MRQEYFKNHPVIAVSKKYFLIPVKLSFLTLYFLVLPRVKVGETTQEQAASLIRFIICYCLFCFVLSQWRPFNWIELTGLQDIKVAFAYNSLVAGQEDARELTPDDP